MLIKKHVFKKYLTWDIFNKKMTENDCVFFLQNFEKKLQNFQKKNY